MRAPPSSPGEWLDEENQTRSSYAERCNSSVYASLAQAAADLLDERLAAAVDVEGELVG